MRRLKKVALSERGVYEPVLTEEDVLGQITQLLETLGAKVIRHVEPVPHCARCQHLINHHERRYAQCKARGCFCFKFLWSKNTPQGGIPDLSGYIAILSKQEPQHFYIEVKRPGGRHRAKQTVFIEEAKAAGCLAIFADSVESVVEQFKGFGVSLNVGL